MVLAEAGSQVKDLKTSQGVDSSLESGVVEGLSADDRGRTTLKVTQGQILSRSPTHVTRFWWYLMGVD